MSIAIGVMNTTFRNVGSGQLGLDYSILGVKPPELTSSYFTSQNTRPATTTYQTPTFQPNYQTPTFQPVGTNQSSLKLDNIFDSSVGLASQLITAFGRNPNQQITGSSSVQALVAPQQNFTPYGSAGQQPTPQQYAAAQMQNGGVGASAVNTATGFLDGIAQSFGISTTVLMLLGVGGAYLLFRQPPSRR